MPNEYVICLTCHEEFLVGEGYNEESRLFCQKECQKEFWKKFQKEDPQLNLFKKGDTNGKGKQST